MTRAEEFWVYAKVRVCALYPARFVQGPAASRLLDDDELIVLARAGFDRVLTWGGGGGTVRLCVDEISADVPAKEFAVARRAHLRDGGLIEVGRRLSCPDIESSVARRFR